MVSIARVGDFIFNATHFINLAAGAVNFSGVFPDISDKPAIKKEKVSTKGQVMAIKKTFVVSDLGLSPGQPRIDRRLDLSQHIVVGRVVDVTIVALYVDLPGGIAQMSAGDA